MDGSKSNKGRSRKSFEQARRYESPWIPMSSPELTPIRDDLVLASRDGTLVARGRYRMHVDDPAGEITSVPQDAWLGFAYWDDSYVSLESDDYWEDIAWCRADLERVFFLGEPSKESRPEGAPRGRRSVYAEHIWLASVMVAHEHGVDDEQRFFVDKLMVRLAEMGFTPERTTVTRSAVVKKIYDELRKGNSL